jgi:thiamine-monophosphate kinase
MVLRTTARAGDVVCLTGTVGDAALGLALRAPPGSATGADENWQASLTPGDRGHLVDRYLHPQPRIALARTLREYASAAMDVSDGLAGDLAKMLRVSGVTAVVDVDRVPLSRAVRAATQVEPRLVDRALTGGDDYEILCTVAPERLADFEAEAHNAGVSLSAIGQIVEGTGLPAFLVHGTERRFGKGSFSHF